MTKATFEAELLPHLADILMGGAHADEHLDGREVDAVVELLTGLIKDADELPEPLRNRIDAFDPEQFDIKRTAYAMGDLSCQKSMMKSISRRMNIFALWPMHWVHPRKNSKAWLSKSS